MYHRNDAPIVGPTPRLRRRRRSSSVRDNPVMYQIAEADETMHPISFLRTVSYVQFEASSSSSSSSDGDDELDEYMEDDSVLWDFEIDTYADCQPYCWSASYGSVDPSLSFPLMSNYGDNCEFHTMNDDAEKVDSKESNGQSAPNEIVGKPMAAPGKKEPYTVEEPCSDSDMEFTRRNTINTGPTIEELSD